jgi:hypothetical protein
VVSLPEEAAQPAGLLIAWRGSALPHMAEVEGGQPRGVDIDRRSVPAALGAVSELLAADGLAVSEGGYPAVHPLVGELQHDDAAPDKLRPVWDPVGTLVRAGALQGTGKPSAALIAAPPKGRKGARCQRDACRWLVASSLAPSTS